MDNVTYMIDRIDSGELVPSREMLDNLRLLNAAVARWAVRQKMPLKAVRK
jgi:hypothetical protein